MKNVLRAKDTATKLMHRIIVDGKLTSLWYDLWINHKSMVDLLGGIESIYLLGLI